MRVVHTEVPRDHDELGTIVRNDWARPGVRDQNTRIGVKHRAIRQHPHATDLVILVLPHHQVLPIPVGHRRNVRFLVVDQQQRRGVNDRTCCVDPRSLQGVVVATRVGLPHRKISGPVGGHMRKTVGV